MIVYGSSILFFVCKVLVFVVEKGLMFENKLIGLGLKFDEFMVISLFGKILVFEDGGYKLCDLSVIVYYMDVVYLVYLLILVDVKDWGYVVWFDEYVDMIMFVVFVLIFWNCVFVLCLNMLVDEVVVVKVEFDVVLLVFFYLECVVFDVGGFLIGDMLMLVDIVVCCLMVNGSYVGLVIDLVIYLCVVVYVVVILVWFSFVMLIDVDKKMMGF